VFGNCSEKSPVVKNAFVHRRSRNSVLTCDAERLFVCLNDCTPLALTGKPPILPDLQTEMPFWLFFGRSGIADGSRFSLKSADFLPMNGLS